MGQYRLEETKYGLQTLIYSNLREIRLHSVYDPKKEAERSIGNFKKGRANLIVVCGLGLGYHIDQLKKKYPDCFIIVAEKDVEVVNILNNTYPEHIQDVTIVNSSKDLPAIFEAIDISIVKGVSTYIHRPSYNIYNDFYDDILKDIKKYISSKISDLLTRFEFEEKWIENIMGNIHNIFCSTPVLDLFSKFKNYPGIIVSAGPSLAKNVKLLNNIRDKAIIVCVDTALKVLQKNNISPHIVITLDSQKYSIKHFQGLKDHNPILLADLVSYPRVIDSYKGRKILSTTSKYYFDKNGNTKRETTPVMDWIEEYISPIGDIQSGGSVATSAFDLLLNLGCSSIVLLGQDLAYTGREIHSRGTHHNDDWLPITSRFRNLETINQNVIRRRKIKYVTSYDGKGDVLSDFVFDLYRHWFEDSAAKVSIPVINATEGGAKIKNTQQYTLKELVKNTPKMEVSPQEIFEKVISQNIEQNPQMLIDGIKSAEESLDEIKSISEKLLKEDFPSDEKLYQVIDEKNISKLLNPFLRRTFLFLARHQDICYEKYMKNFISDVAVASNKVIKLLKDSQRRLETLR